MTKPYKVGDYLTAKELIFFRVAAVVENEFKNPIYGLWTIKGPALQWMTQFELDRKGIAKDAPKFEKFKNIKAGDVVFIGKTDDPKEYRSVLAKVGDIALLSGEGRDQAKMILDIDKFFSEEAGQELLSDKARDEVTFYSSSHNMSKSAGEWYTPETMALMNWDVIPSEEEG